MLAYKSISLLLLGSILCGQKVIKLTQEEVDKRLTHVKSLFSTGTSVE